MAINAKEVGQRIRQRRMTLSIPTAQVASNLCISTDHLRKIELGYYTPSLELIAAMSDYLHMSIDYLVFGSQMSPDIEDRIDSVIEELAGIKNSIKWK